jgi:hypothetical protein
VNLRIRIVALVVSLALLGLIVDLVRKRRLREEYAWLWVVTGAAIFLVAVWQDLLLRLTAIVGAKIPVSVLFFAGLIFLTVISIHFSTHLSRLADQTKELAQKVAILDGELQEMRADRAADGADGAGEGGR